MNSTELQIELKNITLSEETLIQKDKHLIPLVWIPASNFIMFFCVVMSMGRAQETGKGPVGGEEEALCEEKGN